MIVHSAAMILKIRGFFTELHSQSNYSRPVWMKVHGDYLYLYEYINSQLLLPYINQIINYAIPFFLIAWFFH